MLSFFMLKIKTLLYLFLVWLTTPAFVVVLSEHTTLMAKKMLHYVRQHEQRRVTKLSVLLTVTHAAISQI